MMKDPEQAFRPCFPRGRRVSYAEHLVRLLVMVVYQVGEERPMRNM